jgi:transitional endoplasmic reticulum ATPase
LCLPKAFDRTLVDINNILNAFSLRSLGRHKTCPYKIKMTDTKILPAWAEDLRKRYLRGESSLFILHGNVYDVILHDGKKLSVTEFLTNVLLRESRETIVVYNLSSGASFPKRAETFSNWQEIAVEAEKAKVLTMLERSVSLSDKTAVILEYAEVIAPDERL